MDHAARLWWMARRRGVVGGESRNRTCKAVPLPPGCDRTLRLSFRHFPVLPCGVSPRIPETGTSCFLRAAAYKESSYEPWWFRPDSNRDTRDHESHSLAIKIRNHMYRPARHRPGG